MTLVNINTAQFTVDLTDGVFDLWAFCPFDHVNIYILTNQITDHAYF